MPVVLSLTSGDDEKDLQVDYNPASLLVNLTLYGSGI